jgi:nucleoside-diphosphate kinase
MSSRTLALIKPDAVANGKVGAVIREVEQANFVIVDMWMMTWTLSEAEAFYVEHCGKHFFEALVAFMSSGPLVALVLEDAGENAVERWRALMGPADANRAPSGTLRSLFGDRAVMYRNAVHGSDSVESFRREVMYMTAWRVTHVECAGELYRRLVAPPPKRVTGLPCYPNGELNGEPREELPDFLRDIWEQKGRPNFVNATNPYRDVREE